MLKLHHVLYITEPDIALKLDGRTVLACHADGRAERIPLHLLQGIVSFSHIPPTQALAKTCAWEGIGFASFSENGRFQYRIVGASRGNVLLRKRQYLLSEDTAGRVELARLMIQGKIYGAAAVLHRYAKNHPELADLTPVEGRLKALAGLAFAADEEPHLRGIEGIAAKEYFGVFGRMLLSGDPAFSFTGRNRRPPKDPCNALLSLTYGIAPYLKVLLPIMFLMSREPHLSGALLILGIGAVLMFVGGISWKWVGLAAAVGGCGVAALLSGIFPYGQSRIAMWKDPFIDAQKTGYQLAQSLISIGSGGLTGLGLGRSRQKYLYLPEEHNDFIFAIVCEELGLVGAVIIMLLFAALILRGFQIAQQAPDRFGSLLAVGVISQLAMQTFLNIGVVTGLLPTTGASLPFFSYGGTALFLQLVEMGIVLSVSRQTKTAGETDGSDKEEARKNTAHHKA